MGLVLDRNGRVRAACRNPLTLIGRDICASHVVEVWDLIPKYIDEELCRGFGFRIPGLITFGCKTRFNCAFPVVYTVDKFVHMIINGTLANTYGLKTQRVPYTLAAESELNVAKISQELNMPRYAVQAAIEEVIHAFKRAIVTYREVTFVFEGIGCLRIKDNIVTEHFDQCFLDRHLYFKRTLRYKIQFPCVCEVKPYCKPSENEDRCNL